MTGTVERACTVTPRHRTKGKTSEKNDPGTSASPRALEPSKSPSHLPSALPSLTVSSLSPSLRVLCPRLPSSLSLSSKRRRKGWTKMRSLKKNENAHFSKLISTTVKLYLSKAFPHQFFKVFHLRSCMTEYISQSPSWPCNSSPKWVWVESHCLECPEWGPECGSRFQPPGCLNSLIVTLLELGYWERCCQTKDGPSFPHTHIQPNSKSCLLYSSSFYALTSPHLLPLPGPSHQHFLWALLQKPPSWSPTITLVLLQFVFHLEARVSVKT